MQSHNATPSSMNRPTTTVGKAVLFTRSLWANGLRPPKDGGRSAFAHQLLVDATPLSTKFWWTRRLCPPNQWQQSSHTMPARTASGHTMLPRTPSGRPLGAGGKRRSIYKLKIRAPKCALARVKNTSVATVQSHNATPLHKATCTPSG